MNTNCIFAFAFGIRIVAGPLRERVRQAFFIVEPNGTQLAEAGKLLEAGKLRTALDMVLPVSAATEAYAGTVARCV